MTDAALLCTATLDLCLLITQQGMLHLGMHYKTTCLNRAASL